MLNLKMKKSLGLVFAFSMMLIVTLGGFQSTVSAESGEGASIAISTTNITTETHEITGTFTEPDNGSGEYFVKVSQGNNVLDIAHSHTASLTWWTHVHGLVEGELTVELLDSKGNSYEPKVVATTMVTAPEPPPVPTAPELTVQEVFAGATMVSGTATPGSTVIVTVGNGESKSTVALPDATWSVSLGAPLKEGETVTVTATSGGMVTKVTVTAVSLELTVQEVGVGATTVFGTATPGSIVTVTVDNGAPKTTEALPDSTWSVSLDAPLKENEIVNVTATKDGVSTTVEESYQVGKPAITINKPIPGDTVVTGTFSNAPVKDFTIEFYINSDVIPYVTAMTNGPSNIEGEVNGTWSYDLSYHSYALQVGDEIEVIMTDSNGINEYASAQTVVQPVASAEGAPPPSTEPETSVEVTSQESSNINPKTFNSGFAAYLVTAASAGVGLMIYRKRR